MSINQKIFGSIPKVFLGKILDGCECICKRLKTEILWDTLDRKLLTSQASGNHGPVGVPRFHFEKRCANQFAEGNPETQSHSQDALSQPNVQTTLWCLDATQPDLM